MESANALRDPFLFSGNSPENKNFIFFCGEKLKKRDLHFILPETIRFNFTFYNN